MNPSSHLYQLQKIDSRGDAIEQRLITIQAMIDEDQRKLDAQTASFTANQNFANEQKNLTKIEDELLARRVKLEQSESNLYSGRVKNPKELQDIQNEIAAIKRSIATLEDQQLESMIRVEALQQEKSAAESFLQKIEAQVSSEQASLLGEKTQLQNEQLKLSTERKVTLQQIAADNLLKYDKFRKTKRGVAVAAVTDHSCSACGGDLTPGDCQTARSSPNLFFCPHCGRIMFAG
ncbi:MAG TPA: hypothetical protein PKD23_04420 [Bellilinea sp.]|jgi:predicted  nucleic acid-binding Zn-ribbon protein|nr:hypothetical protein [Bellilinea sp.]